MPRNSLKEKLDVAIVEHHKCTAVHTHFRKCAAVHTSHVTYMNKSRHATV